MSMPPTRLPDPWKSRTGAGPRRGRPRRKIEPAQASAAIDRGLHAFVGRSFPDLWEDLSDDGREMFVRGLMEAASRPPEDREQAITEVVATWYEAQSLLYAPLDDEPYTAEDAAATEAAMESVAQG